MEEQRTFNSQPKKEILKWSAAEKSKWVNVNGEREFWTYKTDPVEIITLENCKVYFRKVFADHSYEPKELQKIGEKKYRFKEQQSSKYFEIDPSGNLLYKDGDEIIDTYPKINERG